MRGQGSRCRPLAKGYAAIGLIINLWKGSVEQHKSSFPSEHFTGKSYGISIALLTGQSAGGGHALSHLKCHKVDARVARREEVVPTHKRGPLSLHLQRGMVETLDRRVLWNRWYTLPVRSRRDGVVIDLTTGGRP